MLNRRLENFDKNIMKSFCAIGSYNEIITVDNIEYTIILCSLCKEINFKSNKSECICYKCSPKFKN